MRTLQGAWQALIRSSNAQALNIPLVAPSLGAVESLITRPATTTHVGMSQEERQVPLQHRFFVNIVQNFVCQVLRTKIAKHFQLPVPNPRNA